VIAEPRARDQLNGRFESQCFHLPGSVADLGGARLVSWATGVVDARGKSMTPMSHAPKWHGVSKEKSKMKRDVTNKVIEPY